MDVIKFGSSDPAFGFLSNFYPSPIEFEGRKYPTVEHLYQALKTINEQCHEYVRSSPGPGTAKKRGREVPVRADWNEIKVTAMRICLRLKFWPGSELAEWLLDTDSLTLVEDAPWDEFWGNGKTGSGKNMLGVLLMEIRQELLQTGQGELAWRIAIEVNIGDLEFSSQWL